MGELLDYNVKLSDLQNQYSSVFEGTGEKRRTLENMDERKIEKRLEKTEYLVNTLTEKLLALSGLRRMPGQGIASATSRKCYRRR